MDFNIKLADNTIESSELDQLCDWIKEGNRLTKGPVCLEFENEFSKWQGSRYSVFVNSGSSANLLMVQALLEGGYLRNKVVIAPAVSWVTTITPLMQLGFDVKLCDCDSRDLGLDVAHFEKLCAEHRPAMVILVHVLGHANQMAKIQDICERYDVLLVEDSCEALGSTLDTKKMGSIGKAGSFSFYYGHHISTIEGGMVVTDDEELYHLMLSIRSHGWGRDVPDAVHLAWKSDYQIDEVRDLYTFFYSGFNLRSTDLNAVLGLSQIKKLDQIVRIREENFKTYEAGLTDFWKQQSDTDTLSSFAYAILVKDRLSLFQLLRSKNIETRPLICGNIGLHPFWIKKNGKTSLPNADIVHYNGLYLPNHANLSAAEIVYICEAVHESKVQSLDLAALSL